MPQKQIRRSNNGSYPWLVYPKEYKNRFFFYRPILSSSGSKRRPRIQNIPALKGTFLCYSSIGTNNWFLSYENTTNLFVWNQSSGKTITLPPLLLTFCKSILWLSSTSGKGLVLLLHSSNQSIIFCKIDINNVDESCLSWNVMNYGEKMREMFGDAYVGAHLDHPVCYNGDVYMVYHHHHIVIIKVDVDDDDDDELFFEPIHYKMPSNDGIGSHYYAYFLVSLGDLITIYITMGGAQNSEIIDVEIYNFDFESKGWNRVVNNKDRVIFLSSSSSSLNSFSCLTNDKDIAGRVFLMRYGDRYLYSFNIEDESLTITLPCSNYLPMPWIHSPYWVPPIDHDDYDAEDGEDDYDYRDGELDENADSISMRNTQNARVVVIEEEKISYFNKLVVDEVEEILKKVGFIDYMNFRMVNNSCRLAAPLTNLPKSETQLSLPPWSILSIDQRIYMLVDPISNKKHFMKIPEHLVYAKIRYSRYGWLLMSNKSSCCMFFYNPFTKDTIRLPDPSRGYFSNPTFCFLSSSSSTLSSWVCFGLLSLDSRRMKITCTKSGENRWHEVVCLNDTDFEANNNTPVVLYDKDGHCSFYFLGKHGNLGVLSLEENVLEWEVLENPETPLDCKSYESNFLIECGGELVSVFVGEVGIWVKVFKLNHVQMVWERVNDLGNYMLFIGRYSCFSQLATIPSMANKIYFPKFSRDDRNLYFCLQTGEFHYSELGIGMASHGNVVAPAFNSFRSDRIKGSLHSCWIPLKFS